MQETKLIGYRYRIYPTTEQIIYFAKCFGCVRFYWNHALEQSKNNLKNTNLASFDTPAKFKNDYDFLREIDSLTLANTQLNLQKAWRMYFKKDNNFGKPNFKKKRDGYPSFTTNNQNGTIKLSDKYLTIPKLKSKIKIKKHREFNGKIKSVTITREPSGKYYASILIETNTYNTLNDCDKNKYIGLDLGVTSLITDSDGNKYENIKTTKKYARRKAKEQRKLARKQFGSKNYEKQRVKVAKVDEKIRHVRQDHINKLSSKIVAENQTIVVEDLKIKNMMKNHHLAKSIADCGWGEIVRQLEYKCDRNSRNFIKIDTFFASSKICSCCGVKNPKIKNLSIRNWTCPCCDTRHDRDINAANNILNEGIKKI